MNHVENDGLGVSGESRVPRQATDVSQSALLGTTAAFFVLYLLPVVLWSLPEVLKIDWDREVSNLWQVLMITMYLLGLPCALGAIGFLFACLIRLKFNRTVSLRLAAGSAFASAAGSWLIYELGFRVGFGLAVVVLPAVLTLFLPDVGPQSERLNEL